jgi:hypothetical protein
LLVVDVVVIDKDEQKKKEMDKKETAQKLLTYGNYREKKTSGMLADRIVPSLPHSRINTIHTNR